MSTSIERNFFLTRKCSSYKQVNMFQISRKHCKLNEIIIFYMTLCNQYTTTYVTFILLLFYRISSMLAGSLVQKWKISNLHFSRGIFDQFMHSLGNRTLMLVLVLPLLCLSNYKYPMLNYEQDVFSEIKDFHNVTQNF